MPDLIQLSGHPDEETIHQRDRAPAHFMGMDLPDDQPPSILCNRDDREYYPTPDQAVDEPWPLWFCALIMLLLSAGITSTLVFLWLLLVSLADWAARGFQVAAVLLMLNSCAPCPATEIAGVDPSQLDKQAHFLAGGVIGATTIAAVNALAPQWPWWAKLAAPIAAAALIGEAKELSDRRPRHDSDVRDFRATLAGGCAVTMCLSWTF